MAAKLALPGLVLALVVAVYLGGKAMKVEKSTVLETAEPPVLETADPPAVGMAYSTFASGCFWCTEVRISAALKGVHPGGLPATPAYSVKNPTYKQVCTGTTGHAEAIQITYDPKVISFEELLEVFWETHDPTTPNQQGNDIGTPVPFSDLLPFRRAEEPGRTLLEKAR